MKKNLYDLRKKSIIIKLNERELNAINSYCDRYNIENRSQWIRDLIINEIRASIEIDIPKLFTDYEIRQ